MRLLSAVTVFLAAVRLVQDLEAPHEMGRARAILPDRRDGARHQGITSKLYPNNVKMLVRNPPTSFSAQLQTCRLPALLSISRRLQSEGQSVMCLKRKIKDAPCELQ
jgi:hypothetical protein